MNKLAMVCALGFMIFVSGCDVSPDKFQLKVIRWGPQTTDVVSIPNIQPDGNMGLWIEVADTEGLGDAQVFFAGQPAKITEVREKLILALIPRAQINEVGHKEVIIKQVSSGKKFPVGTFVVVAKK